MSDWKLDLAQLNGSGHSDAAVTRDTPASRVGDLGNESVSVKSVEDARDLRALAFWVGDGFQIRRVVELVSDIGIRESADRVLPAQ